MDKTKLETLSGLQLGQMVNNKEVSASEVMQYFKRRVERRNPSINAFTYTKFDEAEEAAKEVDRSVSKGNAGRFAGVPTALKDFLPTKKGWTASHGGVECMQTVDDANSPFYEAVSGMGAIAVGKTNAPAFGFRGTTDNKMYGATSTPFKPGYNSGGSSGGSAAAVGDGLVAFAEGGDAGGSIRIPAAWCGCFGFKPSAGLVPSICRPDAWAATHPYCCGGPITRTVDDAAAIFQHMVRYDYRDPLSVHYDVHKFEEGLKYDLASKVEKLRIGYTLNFNMFPIPEDEVVEATMNVVKMLEKHVKSINPVKFKFSSSKTEIENAWLHGINIDDAMNDSLPILIQLHREQFPDAFVKWNEIAKKSTLSDYRKFHEVRTDILDAHANVFDECDIIIAPVTGCLPVKNASDSDTKGPDSIAGITVDPLIGFGYTYLENMVGNPASSVPAGLSSSGLPIGVQIIGRRYSDLEVFLISKMIENLAPWSYDIPFSRM